MPGLKSKTTALSGWPMRTGSPSTAPSCTSRASTPSRLSRSARKPTASSLLKSVWRTQRSGLLAAHPPALAGLGDGEVVAAVDRAAAGSRCACASTTGRRGPRRGDDLGHREGQLAQPVAGGGATRRRRAARAPGGPRRPSRRCRWPSGTSTLFSATRRGRSSRPPYRLELVLDHVEVVDRVAAGLDGGGVDDVHDRGAALDVAQEVVARGRGPRRRPRSGRARRRR